MSERLVVIGGDAGGMSAASQARRGNKDLEIVAFERGNFTSFSACGIPYYVGDVVTELDELIARSPETFRDRFDIDVRMRHEVTEIDLDRRRVIARNLETGSDVAEHFDHLMIATGATPIRPDWPGVESEGVFGVQILDDGTAIKEMIRDRQPSSAVVVGAGYIGIEMAEAFSTLGIQTSVVERLDQPMATLDPDMGALVADAMRARGVAFYGGESVTGFEQRDGRVGAVVTDARSLPADIVVLGLGVRPNSALARAAGIATGHTGGIVTDRSMRTSAEGVWAAGDCVEVFHRVARRPVAIALGTHANKQGRVAGTNIAGGYATFEGVVGTAVSKICEYEVARTGLKESEADENGFRYVTVTVDSTTRSRYYPGSEPIKTKVLAERRSGRLLGAQIIGKEGAAKRIDVFATALWNEMTVEDIAGMDLSYAPPFSPVWDPVLIAARKAWDEVVRDVEVNPS